MDKFISDEEMIQLEASQPSQSTKKIISDEEMAELEASQPTEFDSAARGVIQGATMGFADEIAGGVEALWEKAKGDPTAFGELYKAKRDESRSNFKRAEDTNPKSYMAGQAGGAISTALIPGMGQANVAKLAAQGAAMGLGSSEADLTEGEFANAAKDTLVGAGTGAVVGGAGKLLSKAGSAVGNFGKEVIEDVATAPITREAVNSAPQGAMGMAAKSLKTVGKIGDKFDDMTSSFTKGVAGTGNEVADKVVNQVAKKASYAIPGVGKVVAAADAASAAPAIAQKTAYYSAQALEKIAPSMGRFAPVMMDAAQRGGTSLAATHFILQQTQPEYREMLKSEEDREQEE